MYRIVIYILWINETQRDKKRRNEEKKRILIKLNTENIDCGKMQGKCNKKCTHFDWNRIITEDDDGSNCLILILNGIFVCLIISCIRRQSLKYKAPFNTLTYLSKYHFDCWLKKWNDSYFPLKHLLRYVGIKKGIPI